VPIPNWLRQGLRYAPLAALAAVVVPEIVMQQGQLIAPAQDARLYAALGRRRVVLVAARHPGHHRRGHGVLLPLRLGLGW
jgi:branched-subunit amino acid transport protein